MNPKQMAAEAAVQYVKSGMNVGLGTGSTANFFLDALGQAVRAGKLAQVRGVPTSLASEERARGLGIPTATLAECPALDVCVDGADEVDPNLDLVKGLGGALLREKIVAQAGRLFVVIADASKEVPVLGTKAPLPVEVTPFGHEAQVPFFRSLGAEPALRQKKDGAGVFVTDNGNYIYDCRFPGIHDPAGLQAALRARAGVVETGLFIGMAGVVLLAGDAGVETRTRKG